MLHYFRKQNLPIFHVQHISSQDGTFFLPDSNGANIHKEIAPLKNEKVVIKHFPNSFHETTLLHQLKEAEIEELVVCGMMTHMCIDTTVRASKDYGYKIVLIADACATKDLEWNGITLPANMVQSVYMASLNKVFAEVITSSDFFHTNN